MSHFGGAGVDNHPQISGMYRPRPRISHVNAVAEHSFKGAGEDALRDSTIQSEKEWLLISSFIKNWLLSVSSIRHLKIMYTQRVKNRI
jgi:hypothetical protein